MIQNLADFPKSFTWGSFYEEAQKRYTEYLHLWNSRETPASPRVDGPFYRCFDTGYTLIPRGFTEEFPDTPRMHFLLVREHPAMSFELPFCIDIQQDHENACWKARWHTYSQRHFEAWQVLHKFTRDHGPCRYDILEPRTIQDFKLFFDHVDLMLTLLAVHPERDRFFAAWVRHFDNQSDEPQREVADDQYITRIMKGEI